MSYCINNPPDTPDLKCNLCGSCHIMGQKAKTRSSPYGDKGYNIQWL